MNSITDLYDILSRNRSITRLTLNDNSLTFRGTDVCEIFGILAKATFIKLADISVMGGVIWGAITC